MATNEQIDHILRELPKAHPPDFLKAFCDINAGIGFALRLLYAAEDKRLSAGAISEAMEVSTARVAVLLRKMESKGLVTKENAPEDARVKLIALSERGRTAAEQMNENVRKHISGVIDRVGIEKFEQFLALAVEVNTAMRADLPEEIKA